MIKLYDYIITTKDISDKKDTISIGSIGTIIEIEEKVNGNTKYLIEFSNNVIMSASENEIKFYKKLDK